MIYEKFVERLFLNLLMLEAKQLRNGTIMKDFELFLSFLAR